MRNKKSTLARAVAAAGISLLATGCLNIYSPVDAPSGDAQLLSAARACFDRGDYSCAQSNYQKLSSSYSDITSNEQAMATLDQNGVGMSAFLTFVGNGANGRGLTAMAESIAPGSTAKRSAIYGALVQSGFKNGTTGRTQLQYFTQFMTGLALAAELLAEGQGSNSQLLKSLIVNTPSSCTTSGCASGCAHTNSTFGSTTITDIATTEPTGAVSIDMLFWAIKYAYNGINGLGTTGGSFSSTGSDLNAIFAVGQPSQAALADQCFRAQLLNFGIGR